MAKSFNESISDLSGEMHELSKLIRDIGDKKLRALLKSKDYTEAAKSVAAVNKYESAIGIFRRAGDVREAKLAMRREPNRWASPLEYLEWRDIRKRQKRLGIEYVQGQKRAFAEYSLNRSDIIPSLLRNNISKYGAKGGKQAFQDAVNDRLLQISDPTAYAYEQEKRMYGAENAQRFQDAREEKERRRNHYDYLRKQASERRAERKERKENHYNYLRKQAKERGELYGKAPWIKSLIKSGMINQKYIPGISKTLTRISRTPILGGVTSLAIKHPVASAAMLSAWMARERVLSDIKMTGLSQGPKAFGAVPENFRKAMMATGLSEEQLQKEYYSLVGRYGPGAMQYLTSISKSMASMTPDQRNIVAQGLGMSANLVNAGMYLSGARTPDRAARVTMYNKMLETVSAYGLSEHGSTADWWKSQLLRWEMVRNARALWLSDTDETPFDFRDYRSVFSRSREESIKNAAALESKYNEIMAIIGESQGAANSDALFDSGSIDSSTSNSYGGTVTINQVIYASGNAQEIADKVGDETQEAVNRQRVMDAITTGDKQ